MWKAERGEGKEMERLTGKVAWFNDKRGYGFIQRDDGQEDLFVHYSNIAAEEGQFKTLVAGQTVSFGIGANQRGPQAVEVEVIGEPETEAYE